MKKKFVFLVLILTVFLWSAWLLRDVRISLSFKSSGQEGVSSSGGEIARVARVIDGDTIVLEDGRHVRYVGINAPEIAHEGKAGQCYGEEAKTRNGDLVEKKEVRLVRDVSEKDKYGRFLYFVFVGDVFVEEVLVREGYARKMSIEPDKMRAKDIAEWEKEARSRRTGLWGACP